MQPKWPEIFSPPSIPSICLLRVVVTNQTRLTSVILWNSLTNTKIRYQMRTDSLTRIFPGISTTSFVVFLNSISSLLLLRCTSCKALRSLKSKWSSNMKGTPNSRRAIHQGMYPLMPLVPTCPKLWSTKWTRVTPLTLTSMNLYGMTAIRMTSLNPTYVVLTACLNPYGTLCPTRIGDRGLVSHPMVVLTSLASMLLLHRLGGMALTIPSEVATETRQVLTNPRSVRLS